MTYFLFHVRQQSTPIGSMQTGQDVVVSPNRDKHATANKVKTSFFSKMFKCWWKKWKKFICAKVARNKNYSQYINLLLEFNMIFSMIIPYIKFSLFLTLNKLLFRFIANKLSTFFYMIYNFIHI